MNLNYLKKITIFCEEYTSIKFPNDHIFKENEIEFFNNFGFRCKNKIVFESKLINNKLFDEVYVIDNFDIYNNQDNFNSSFAVFKFKDNKKSFFGYKINTFNDIYFFLNLENSNGKISNINELDILNKNIIESTLSDYENIVLNKTSNRFNFLFENKIKKVNVLDIFKEIIK